MDYLVSKGIEKRRLIARGFGEKKPIYSDKEVAAKVSKEDQEILHQKNRRAAFRIIGEGFIKGSDNQ